MSVGESRVAEAARRGPTDADGGLAAAVGFLTRLPLGDRAGAAAAASTGAAAFGLVGGLVGAVVGLPMLLVGGLDPTIAAILAIVAGVILTGAIHLDGLADTADALLVPDPARAEAARTDPATGPGGVVAVVLVIGLEAAALASLAAAAGPVVAAVTCIAAGAVSRTVAVVAGLAMRSRAAGRLGTWFAERLRLSDAGIAVVSAVLLAGAGAVVAGAVGGAAAGPSVAVGAGVGALLGLAASWLIAGRRGQLDGDGLGASIELSFVAVVVATAIAVTILTANGTAS
jgi:adenosylcobinamide-GDP ribazoletransferase